MKREIRQRDRRALLLLGVLLGLYFVLSEVAFPAYGRLAAAGDTARDREDQLRRYRRAAVQKADYGPLLEEARRRVEEGEGLLIRGDNPSLASAELQTIIEGIAADTGVELGQRNMSAAVQKDEFFNEITMTLGFECTPGQLVMFLEQLRRSEKLVAVRSIRIAPLSVADEVSAGMELPKDLRVNLTVGAVLASPPEGEPAED